MRQLPTTSSSRKRNASSCMLIHVQTWLGTTVSTSPTRKLHEDLVISKWPCSSFNLINGASGASTTRPCPARGPELKASEERVFDPASIMAHPGTAVETTVVTTRVAQSFKRQAP